MGITPLVTTKVKIPASLSAGRIWLSSRCRIMGSPPTSDTCSGLCLSTSSKMPRTSASPAKIAEFPQSGSAAEMLRAIGVATGTAERAFSRDLNRQEGGIPAQNTPPSRQDFSGCETSDLATKSSYAISGCLGPQTGLLSFQGLFLSVTGWEGSQALRAPVER